MEDIDRAIELCTELDADFPALIRGAAPEAIAAIETAMGRRASAGHRRFLERLGAGTAWLRLGSHDTSAEAVLAAHRSTSGTLPPGYELLGVATDEPFEDLYRVEDGGVATLELLNTRRGCDYGNLAGERGQAIAGSITEHICLKALAQRRLDQLPFRTWLQPRDGSSAPLLEGYAAVVAALGFEPLWFGSWMTRAFQRRQTVTFAKQVAGAPVAVMVAAASGTSFGALCARLMAELPLSRTS